MTSVIGPSILPEHVVTLAVAVLTVVGGILAAAISVTFAYVLFTGETPHVLVNGGWFIPPVVMIIIPLALASLIPQLDGGNARLLLVLGYAFYGLGFLLFLFMMGLLHDRLILHTMPRAPLAPSLWIALGPVGVGVLALLALAHVAAPMLQTGAAAVVVHQPARRDRPVGVRGVVAGGGTARALSPHRPASFRPGLVGVHLPARCIHGGHPGPRPSVGHSCSGGLRSRVVHRPCRFLDPGDSQHTAWTAQRAGLETLSRATLAVTSVPSGGGRNVRPSIGLTHATSPDPQRIEAPQQIQTTAEDHR